MVGDGDGRMMVVEVKGKATARLPDSSFKKHMEQLVVETRIRSLQNGNTLLHTVVGKPGS